MVICSCLTVCCKNVLSQALPILFDDSWFVMSQNVVREGMGGLRRQATAAAANHFFTFTALEANLFLHLGSLALKRSGSICIPGCVMSGHLLWWQPHHTCYALRHQYRGKISPISHEVASGARKRRICIEPLFRSSTGSIIGADFLVTPLWNYPRRCLHGDIWWVRINLKDHLLKCLAMQIYLTDMHRLKYENLKTTLQYCRIRLCFQRSFACSASARRKARQKLPQVGKPKMLSAEARKTFFFKYKECYKC